MKVEDLLGLLTLERLDTDLFRGEHPETILPRSFGGQVLAQGLEAVYQTTPEGRLAHSLKGYFLRPGKPTHPLLFHVSSTRDGRSFSSRRVTARQDGETIFDMTVSLKTPEEGLEHAEPAFHPPKPPEECVPLAEVLGQRSRLAATLWENEWSVIDARYACDSGADHAEHVHMQVWLKASGRLPDDPRIHHEVLAYASDLTLLGVSTVPHPVEFMSPTLQIATIDHSMWFHRPIRADEWVLYDQGSPNAANALGLSLGRLYSADGVLGASTAQEGLIRVVAG